MAEEPKIFTASRLTEGNRVFPAEIKIDHIGVTIKEPGLFSDSEKTIPFSRIASVDIDCPLVGYSSITLETTGEDSQRINGFTQDEAREMKELILKRI